MAAAKVFGIPELLEKVFVNIAYVAIIEEDEKPMRDDPILEPLTTLAPYHRVSQEFNSTLKDSPRLQRLMRNGSPAYNDHLHARLRPARWLALRFGEKMPTGLLAMPYVFFLHPIGEGMGDKRTKAHNAPEASWRKVNFIGEGAQRLTPVLGGMTRTWVEGTTQGFASLKSIDILQVHKDVTLGDFETWLDNSALVGCVEGYEIDDKQYGVPSEAAVETYRIYRRGTFASPQVLRAPST